MFLSFKSIRSGSSGNLYLVKSENAVIAVDFGLSSQKAIVEGLKKQGIRPEDLDAILVSHTHTDHISYSGLRVGEEYGLCIMLPVELVNNAMGLYAKKRLARPPDGLLEGFQVGQPRRFKDIVVKSFKVPHDVVPTSGFRFELAGRGNGPAITMATDLGYVPADVKERFLDSNLVVIEANYDEMMLQNSSRPFQQKVRINGPKGHLSNTATAAFIAELCKRGRVPDHVMLAHLSKDHNTPQHALNTITDYLVRKFGVRLNISVAPRKEESDWITVF